MPLVSRPKDFTLDGKDEDEPVDQAEYNDFCKSRGGDVFKDACSDILFYATDECTNCGGTES